MTPEEQLAKILKQNQNIVFGKTIGTDADGNCTVQTGESSILARSGGQISAGDCVAMKADDGQWYAVSSRVTGTVDKKTLFSERRKPSNEESAIGETKALYMAAGTNREVFLGGDRSPAVSIYTAPEGYGGIGAVLSVTGEGLDDWIVQGVCQKYGFFPYTWEAETIYMTNGTNINFSVECSLTENGYWYVSTQPLGIDFSYTESSIDGLRVGDDPDNYRYVVNPRLGNFASSGLSPEQLYLRFQLSDIPDGDPLFFSSTTFDEELFEDRWLLVTITPDVTIEIKDSGLRVIEYTIGGTVVKNILEFEPLIERYGWWSVYASRLSHWYLDGALHSRWNGIKANFKIEQDTPIPITVYNNPSFIPEYKESPTGVVPDNAEGLNGDFRIEAITTDPSYGQKLYKKVAGTWQLQAYSDQNYTSQRACQSIPLTINEDLELTTLIVGNRSVYHHASIIGNVGGLFIIRFGFVGITERARFYQTFPTSGVDTSDYVTTIGFAGGSFSNILSVTESGSVISVVNRGFGESLVVENVDKIRYYNGGSFIYLDDVYTVLFLIYTGYLSSGLLVITQGYTYAENAEVRVLSITDPDPGSFYGTVKFLPLLPSGLDGAQPQSVARLLTLEQFEELEDAP